ncbi:hypothetical protein [Streptomyces sp. NPDC058701]|uniref:hypothetical protein n=1 Tax=Streptomyces sp. NPDC058701 TaxID=3346608 RepID=UPI00364BE658
MTRVTAALARGEGMAAARALREILVVLLRFRGKHLTLARRAYPGLAAAQRHGEPGSVIGLLAELTDLTRENKNLLARMTDTATGTGPVGDRRAALARRSHSRGAN